MSIRANSFTGTIFSGGSSRPMPIPNSNGHPGIWAGRSTSTVQASSTSSVTVGTSSEQPKVTTPTDVFRSREGGGGMRVGRDFQARIPACCAHIKEQLIQLDVERALLVWCPTDKVSDSDINAYIGVANEKYGYTREQALGLLYWHGYDISKALEDLGNFTPHPEEWTIEDKIQFEQAFQFHGKAFDRIRQMLPDKSMSSLIRYYYKWKKTRNKSSAMDRHSKRILSQMGTTTTTESLSSTASCSARPSSSSKPNYSLNVISHRQPAVHLSDSDDDITKRQNGDSGGCCRNCGVPCSELSGEDKMCKTCYIYWKKTGNYRPLTGPLRRGDKQLGLFRQNRNPPLGMYINHDDLAILASAPPQAENIIVQGLEKDLLGTKYSIQTLKQKIDILKRQLPDDSNIVQLKPKNEIPALLNPRVNARWTNEELLIAAQGVRLYGKDFSKIVKIIPTKSEAHFKSFYVNYRQRFGLDDLIKEQQMEAGDTPGDE